MSGFSTVYLFNWHLFGLCSTVENPTTTTLSPHFLSANLLHRVVPCLLVYDSLCNVLFFMSFSTFPLLAYLSSFSSPYLLSPCLPSSYFSFSVTSLHSPRLFLLIMPTSHLSPLFISPPACHNLPAIRVCQTLPAISTPTVTRG